MEGVRLNGLPLLTGLLVLGLTRSVSATTYCVKADGDDSHDGLTFATAWKTIQHAAKQVMPGDVVEVQGGRYTEEAAIAVSGTPDAWIAFRANGNVIVDGEKKRERCITIDGSYVRLDGFTCRNNRGWNSAAIFVRGSHAVISNNKVHDVFGCGISVHQANDCTLEANIIRDVAGCGIRIGRSSDPGHTTGSTIKRNLIFGCDTGILLSRTRRSQIRNNTVYRCAKGIHIDNARSHGAADVAAETFILNNIVSSCGQGIEIGTQVAGTRVTYNCLHNNVIQVAGSRTERENISENPRFRSIARWDFRLQPGSPCMDGGVPDPAFNDPDATRNDMGALRYTPPTPPGDGQKEEKVRIGVNRFTREPLYWIKGEPHPRWPGNGDNVPDPASATRIKEALLKLAGANEEADRAGKDYTFDKGPEDIAIKYDAVAALSMLSDTETAYLKKWLLDPAVAFARIQENDYGNGYYTSDACWPVGLVFGVEDLVRRGYLGPVMLLRSKTDADGHFVESTGYAYGSIRRFWNGCYVDYLPHLEWSHDLRKLKFPAYPNPYRHERYGFVREWKGPEHVVWKSGRLYGSQNSRNADDIQLAPDGTTYVVGDGDNPAIGHDALVEKAPVSLTREQYFLPSVNLISRFILRSGPLVDAGLMGLEKDYPEDTDQIKRLALTGRTATKWVTMNLGVPGGWHGHYEKLDIDFDAFGRHWIVSPPSDARETGYQLTTFLYSELTWARNLVCVDGRRQTSGTGQPIFFATCPGLHAGTASAGFVFDDVDHQRTLVLTDDYLAILDDLIPRTQEEGPHVFDWTMNGWGRMSTTLDHEPEIRPFVGYEYGGGIADPMEQGCQTCGVWWRAHYEAPGDFEVVWNTTDAVPDWQGASVSDRRERNLVRGCRNFILHAADTQVGFGQALRTEHGEFPSDAPLAGHPKSLRMPKVLVRKRGARAHFLTLVEPFWQNSRLASVTALDRTGMHIRFKDGRDDLLLVNRTGPRNVLLRLDPEGRLVQLACHGGGLSLGEVFLAGTEASLKALSVRYLPASIQVYAHTEAPAELTIPCQAEVEEAYRNGALLTLAPRGGAVSLPLKAGANAFILKTRNSRLPEWTLSFPQIAQSIPSAAVREHPLLYPSHSHLAWRTRKREGWNQMAFSPDGKFFLSGSYWNKPGKYALYRVEAGALSKRWEKCSDHNEKYFSLSWVPVLASEEDPHLLIHSVPAGSTTRDSPAGIEIWNVQGEPIGETLLEANPNASAWGSAGKRAWFSFGRELVCYRFREGYRLEEQWRAGLDFEPNRLRLAWNAGAVVAFQANGREWAILNDAGQVVKRATVHKYPFLRFMNLSVDQDAETLFAVRNDNQVLCLNSDGSTRWRYDMNSSGTHSMRGGRKEWGWVSRDGRYCMVTGSWGNLCFFDARTGRKLWEWAGVSGGGQLPVHVAFTPNFEYIMAADPDDTFRILTPDGRCVSERPDIASKLHGIAMSRDGRYCATWTLWKHWNGDNGYERHQVFQNDLTAMKEVPRDQGPPVWTQGDTVEEAADR